MLDIHELRVFLAAAETENFSEAGRRLHISQPAVSMQIRALEEQLGISLFQRTGRHIVLTEAGQRMMPLARDVLNRVVQIEETMVSLQGDVVGNIQIGCCAVTGKYVVVRLIAQLRERHPQIDVSCTVGSSESVLDWLLEGRVQLAITGRHEPYRDVVYEPYFEERLVLVAPPDHLWTDLAGPLPLERLREADFVMFSPEANGYDLLKESLGEHHISINELKRALTVNHPETIVLGVQEGIGVGFVPEVLAAEALRNGSVVAVPVQNLEPCQVLNLAYHSRRPASSAQTALWEMAFQGGKSQPLPGQALMSHNGYSLGD